MLHPPISPTLQMYTLLHICLHHSIRNDVWKSSHACFECVVILVVEVVQQASLTKNIINFDGLPTSSRPYKSAA